MSATLNGRSAQLDNSRAADPDPILKFAINGTSYVAFPREQALALCHWVIDTCEETDDVPDRLVVKAKAIANSRVPPTSFSNAADPGSGDGRAASVPASPPSSFKIAPKKPRAAKKAWPVMPDRGALVKQSPRAGTFAETVLGTIRAADEGGLDVAGIVAALETAGVEYQSQDMEKSVTNAIYQTLAAHELIERVERKDSQVFWRYAGA